MSSTVKENQFRGLSIIPGFPPRLSGKEATCHAADTGDAGSIPGSGSSPGGGQGNHSSILAWRIPWTEEPGGPPGGLQRVRHD